MRRPAAALIAAAVAVGLASVALAALTRLPAPARPGPRRHPGLVDPRRRIAAHAKRHAPSVARATAQPPARYASQPVLTMSHPASPPARCDNRPPPEPARPISRPTWIGAVAITEYYPAPERWATGARVHAPGLRGTYAVDWLYGVHGLPMEGDGIDRFGHHAHLSVLGSTGWVNSEGRSTHPVCLGQWSNGEPAWLKGGWRNRAGGVTWPLARGGWANGRPVRYLANYGGVSFRAGMSIPVKPYHSIAVDPRLIPERSRVYIPAYRRINGGWFVAQDTGGAIKGRHIDVYRNQPSARHDLGRYLTGQRVLVLPPG